ncbi:MAG TPA: aminoacyl-tRNA hydrolase [Thermoanaerobaculia bacterium]|nr:aminoacyl-tRNA hydrolase [Thermoanaerobaculia bacterium]
MAVERWDAKPLVLGLGNPGREYEATRHNRGREVVEELARRRGLALPDAECRTRLAIEGDVILAIPETFMNRSGYAARCLVERHGLEPSAMLVVYDDIALPLGALRLRPWGGPGGQRGMASVLECLRTDGIPRLRLGIAPSAGLEPEVDRVEFVLSRFAPDEESAARNQILRAADACELWLEAGAEAVMNRYNRPPGPVSARDEPTTVEE